MKIGHGLIQFSIKRPWTVTIIMVLATVLLGALISMVRVDTDPENMLSEDEAVRVFHNRTKQEFALYDVVVLGIVNEVHPDGVFNPATLKHVEELTGFAATLEDPDDPARRVVARDIIAPGNIDTIEQAGPGQVRFEWLMRQAPTTREGALLVRDSAMANPLLKGTLVSEDGRAICLYLPITSKDFAFEARKQLLAKIATFDNTNGDKYYITGLPVAEDTFGVEMFVQMAVSAPLAMLAIFLLLLLFFKKIRLIISPLIVAMVSVTCTMGLLIGTGHTVHIMSSMIPIFLMPIAVVDSIHILSEFFDSYQAIGDRRKTIIHVMDELFMPMLYTSLTSAAGFASLAMTPIPPVQVFGLFVAFGIMLAWFLTILFIPAYIMMIPETALRGLGAVAHPGHGKQDSFLARMLRWLGMFTFRRAKLIVALTLVALAVAAYGISLIQINDNPVKWFQKNHDIRVADRVLNSHFGGTYEAYLVLEGAAEEMDGRGMARLAKTEITTFVAGISGADGFGQQALALIDGTAKDTTTADFLSRLITGWEAKLDAADDATYDLWADTLDRLEQLNNRDQVFKQPEMLRYIEALQAHLLGTGVVGKSNSVTDVVKKVYQELYSSDPEYFRVPDTIPAVAQSLISFQNSHKPDDLWHFVTPDYTKANIWVQLHNGDNKNMEAVVASVDRYMVDNPPPIPLVHRWAGLTYLNVVWQDKMVSGMAKSFLSSFVVVLIMMTILFRSLLWGFMAMVPLSVTIALIYGIIGLVGKDYDMPVAVLSSLSLGLAVDFAIHFLERCRMVHAKMGSWAASIGGMFEEPARAISRNVIVIAIGFTPLLAAPLLPYKTVGIFLASIMMISGIGTMLIMPALVTLVDRWMFKRKPPGQKQTVFSE